VSQWADDTGAQLLSGIEIGLDSFWDVTRRADGALLSQAEVLRNCVEEGVLADQVGLDFIGFGEHHRDDFAVSSPEVLLGAIAARTGRIRLGSAVTVLSSDDPIRVFQRFSTLNALSNGRAEVIVGRGSFTESFPLFGYPLQQYETLFEEKLDLLVQLARSPSVSWTGSIRPPLQNQKVYPPIEGGSLKIWVGVGGSPESVVRAARHDLPLMLAIIGGDPRRFRPYVDLYHRAFEQFGRPARPIGIHSHGYIAESDEQAREDLWPGYKAVHDRIGAERGWPPTRRENFEHEIEQGSLYVGTPEKVAAKMVRTIRALELSRFEMKYSAGPLAHDKLMNSIRLYGEKVAPMVRDMLA
jgi:probable LLM family oxidoreductase